MGGENAVTLKVARETAGSSPRGRGKLLVLLDAAHRVRLIPAWAGKTGPRPTCARERRAHPRVGGENHVLDPGAAHFAGSSPRGRGKPGLSARTLRRPRLIPAWAGKTRDRRRHRGCKKAHPRVGGENPQSFLAKIAVMGSSPRGRGKPSSTGPPTRWAGLIPAWAGKTLSPRPRISAAQAHPRVGGENSEPLSCAPLIHGSSPRGRGKRIGHCWPASGVGLIPAWAGKTAHRLVVGVHTEAHPRVGGENVTVDADHL